MEPRRHYFVVLGELWRALRAGRGMVAAVVIGGATVDCGVSLSEPGVSDDFAEECASRDPPEGPGSSLRDDPPWWDSH
jgi:hypothetical protein